MKAPLSFLEHSAYDMRQWVIRMTTKAGSGHLSSSLSAAEIMAVLFFESMRYDTKHFDNPNNDRFILSKGHAAPILYAALKQVGMISEDQLLTYRQMNSAIEGHPTFRFSYAQAATGSLGIGLSIGVGFALCARQDNRNYHTYVLLGDSEMSEGAVWEAMQLATFYKLHNIIGVIDCNRLGQSTPTMQALEGDEAKRFAQMVAGFGWKPFIVDGHDICALAEVFTQAKKALQPVMVIAVTKKGYGVSMLEDKEGFHGIALKPADAEKALVELEQRFAKAAAYLPDSKYMPEKPQSEEPEPEHEITVIKSSSYSKGEMIPTRKAYGQALVALGAASDKVISLDAEVKNSTYAELFEQQYPDRFFQCFIAEQNMVSMGVGFARAGKIPFISTFGCFFTRAHDQIRMAAISAASLRLVGSHAGVSIGQDGPSQMALEDIAMMRTIPNAIVLYPSDAVSTYALVHHMSRYHQGISYLRTTRMATPVVYDLHETFPIGGCKIVRQSKQDQAVVIGAGITLHEALKAYEQLKKEGIMIAVIDLYSIQPLDVQTILSIAQSSGQRVITVEDHYMQGGLGEAVAAALCNENIIIKRLAVQLIPRSGSPEELLAAMGIDACAIMKQVHAILSSR